MQLAYDDALCPVDDESPVLGHQRNVAEEDFLLFDVANGAIPGFGVLVENGQTHGDLERRGIGHAALFTLRYVVLQLQSNRIAALVTEVGRVGVVGAALAAQHFAGMKRIGNDRRSAILASGAEVVQALQVAALALPVTNGVIDELQLGYVAKVGDRKDRLKHRLQAAVFALAGQLVHLQEAVVRTLLHFDQVRDLNGGRNFGKIESFTEGIFHRQKLPISRATEGHAQTAECGALMAPRDLCAWNRYHWNPKNTTGRLQGQSFPQTPTKAFRPS